jgi:hypothetical protein
MGRDVALRAKPWNVPGVTVGSTLGEVQKINGKPLLVTGVDSDFSGFVVDCRNSRTLF